MERRIVMSFRKIALGVVLLDFLALTGYVAWQHGLGFFALVFGNSASALAVCDLTIALTLILVWLVPDARERGVSPLPYVVLTLLLGSAGPLLYLIRRPA
jgi:hypothetical protein